MIVFNGVSSDSLGVIVDEYPRKAIARRRIQYQQIPGRNGDLLIDEGVYDNYVQSYTLYWLPSTPNKSISDWLRQEGYFTFIDSDIPGYFRMAQVYGPIDPMNNKGCYTQAVVSFDFKPQWFLDSGNTTITISEASTIVNPTLEQSRPLITVHGSGNGVLKINGKNISLTSIVTSFTIDSELMEASFNNQMSGEFPVLNPGNNTVDWSGGITGVDIKPRWWIS